MSDGIAELKKFLNKHKVTQPAIEYMTKASADGGLGLEAVTDFASGFTELDYQAKCAELILAKTPDKDNIAALGKLRTAWRMAVAELNKAAKAVSEGSTELNDWDTQLGEDDELKRSGEFDAAYDGLQFSAESTPVAVIIGRMYREFRGVKRLMTILALKRMRSEAEYKTVAATKKTDITERVAIVEADEPRMKDVQFNTVLQVLLAFRLLTNGWAMTGTAKVDSRIEYDSAQGAYKKVREIHLSQSTAYYDFVYQKCMEHPGSEGQIIRWIIERDRQTRAKARTMFTSGWPFGEALTNAREVSCAVLWTCGSPGIPRMQMAVTNQDDAMDLDDDNSRDNYSQVRKVRKRPAKKKNKGGKGGKGRGKGGGQQNRKPSCEKWNSQEGCTRFGRDCPEQKAHVCSKCGSWQHIAADCRKRG